MKSSIKILVITTLVTLDTWSCKKETDSITENFPPVPLTCAWPEGYRSGAIFSDLIVQVVQKIDTIYAFKVGKAGIASSGYIYSCNLRPDSTKAGKYARISGHMVTFDGYENAQFFGGDPGEITKIEYLDE